MKRCPSCNSTYADTTLNFCLTDGTPLINDTPASYDPAKTLISTSPQTDKIAPAAPTQAFLPDSSQGYNNPTHQSSTPQQWPIQYASQPQPSIQPHARRGANWKVIIGASLGLVLGVIGIAPGIIHYFRIRAGRYSSSSSSISFVGTWKPAADNPMRKDVDSITLDSNKRYTVVESKGAHKYTGEYIDSGGQLSFMGEFSDRLRGTQVEEIVIESGRMRWRINGQYVYFDK